MMKTCAQLYRQHQPATDLLQGSGIKMVAGVRALLGFCCLMNGQPSRDMLSCGRWGSSSLFYKLRPFFVCLILLFVVFVVLYIFLWFLHIINYYNNKYYYYHTPTWTWYITVQANIINQHISTNTDQQPTLLDKANSKHGKSKQQQHKQTRTNGVFVISPRGPCPIDWKN